MAEYVQIYIDGACADNPGGAGSWAAYFVLGVNTKMISGFEPKTTNNRMELTAAIRALEHLKRRVNAHVISDSKYLVSTMNDGWQRNKNTDLWEQIDALVKQQWVTWEWVKGHNGNELNELVDKECTRVLEENGFKVQEFFRR